jgi:hypothetical protein
VCEGWIGGYRDLLLGVFGYAERGFFTGICSVRLYAISGANLGAVEDIVRNLVDSVGMGARRERPMVEMVRKMRGGGNVF